MGDNNQATERQGFWRNLPLRLGDFVIIGLVLLAALGCTLAFWQGKTDTLYCVVSQNGEELSRIRLVEGYEQTIQLEAIYRGETIYNTIQIDGKTVRFSHATCPDQLCVHAGTLTQGGQIAVCLPAGIILKLEGENALFDGVSQ